MKILSTGGLSYNADCRWAPGHLSLSLVPYVLHTLVHLTVTKEHLAPTEGMHWLAVVFKVPSKQVA